MTETPAAPSLPEGVDIQAIATDLQEDSVATIDDPLAGTDTPGAPIPLNPAALLWAQQKAHNHGVNIQLVEFANRPEVFTQVRDVATEVGKELQARGETEVTVWVYASGLQGSYSSAFPRDRLERAQDVANATKGTAIEKVDAFSAELANNYLPWKGIILSLFLALVVAVAVGVVAFRRHFPSKT